MAYRLVTEPHPVVPQTAEQVIRGDRGQATRFLHRATFGPRTGDVARLQELGAGAWLDEQMSMRPRTSAVDILLSDPDERIGSVAWRTLLDEPDQLRRRVGYALSQIFVVASSKVGAERTAGYIDMLNRHAFGNFRDLLEDVALSPAMARYLSHHRNAPANPKTGSMPDENFAREIMQLFTIGLWELHSDGTRVLLRGEPVPTYDNDDVMGLARCFTGWETTPNALSDRWFEDRMIVWEPSSRWHEQGEKRFLNTVIPPGTDAPTTLGLALDALFHHHNTAPFICRQLIQRLVTSNPSPAYVRRVVAAFEDNGSGVRGDMSATVRAVLLDDEAIDEVPMREFGKIREPVLRFSIVLRMLGVGATTSRWPFTNLGDAADGLGQQPLDAPSVFNFYRPGFVPSASGFDRGDLVSPELQISDEVQAIGWINRLARTIKWKPANLTLDFDDLKELADRPSDLVDELESRLVPGRLRSETRAVLLRAIEQTRHHGLDLQREERVLGGVLIIAASTDFIYER